MVPFGMVAQAVGTSLPHVKQRPGHGQVWNDTKCAVLEMRVSRGQIYPRIAAGFLGAGSAASVRISSMRLPDCQMRIGTLAAPFHIDILQKNRKH